MRDVIGRERERFVVLFLFQLQHIQDKVILFDDMQQAKEEAAKSNFHQDDGSLVICLL